MMGGRVLMIEDKAGITTLCRGTPELDIACNGDDGLSHVST